MSGRKHLDELAEAVTAAGHNDQSLLLNSIAGDYEFPGLVTVPSLVNVDVLMVFSEVVNS